MHQNLQVSAQIKMKSMKKMQSVRVNLVVKISETFHKVENKQ